ncbi:MAG: hypothetical protein IJ097_01230 [Bacilli bacterium]|nr:hypothetical protein [Bacilli bacterium]
MYNLLLFWNIGKKVYEDKSSNAIEKYSNHYSYYYGNSYLFNRENIRLMKVFYICFPIFYKRLNKISWEQYKLLFKINNRRERLFYFYISLFFNSNFEETNDFITNDYYIRI